MRIPGCLLVGNEHLFRDHERSRAREFVANERDEIITLP
jgi:hypothetical protein